MYEGSKQITQVMIGLVKFSFSAVEFHESGVRLNQVKKQIKKNHINAIENTISPTVLAEVKII